MSNTAQYYLERFIPGQLSKARELRGLTKKSLAEKIGKTASAISQFENGSLRPDLETFVRAAMTLQVPPAFFGEQIFLSNTNLAYCHFRAKRSIPQIEKRRSLAYSLKVSEIFSAMEDQGVVFPEENVSKLARPAHTTRELEQLALDVRSSWGLGVGPIPNLLNFLECMGVFIILLDQEGQGLDAFSFWLNAKRPCIMLAYEATSASRLQFDLAHELAHLLIHDEIQTGDSETEREAHRFASAFLAPGAQFKAGCPSRYSNLAFQELKNYWKISKAAALYRAREVGAISDASYRWGMIELGKRGERKNEDGEFQKDRPLLLTQAFNLVKDEITLDGLANDLCLNLQEVEAMLRIQHVPNEIICKMKPTPVRTKPIVLLQKS